jgi:hypothetical protein
VAAERTSPLPGMVDLPPRSLQLTEPVWGIDPSTQRHAVGILVPGHPTVVRWETLSLPLKRNARNAADWYASQFRAIHPFLQQLVAEYGAPVRVDVEEPFAKGKQHVHPSSNRTLGVLLAALGFTLGCPVELVQPNTWKAGSMGAGWGSCTPEQYLKWAQEHAGYTGTLEDEAAGILIATAAGVKEAACVVV